MEAIPILRDISLIILIVPTMLCLMVPLAILIGSNWLMRKGRTALPPKFDTAYQALRKIDEKVDQAGEKIAKPFIAAEMRTIMIKTWWHHLRRGGSKPT